MAASRAAAAKQAEDASGVRSATSDDEAEALPTESPLESALRKTTYAAVRYNPHRDAVMLKAFEHRGLTPQDFKEQLKRLLEIRLTDEEATAFGESLVSKETPPGCVDGTEFLVKFTMLAFEERARVQAERRRLDQEKSEARRQEHHAKLQALETKNRLQVNADFTQQDFDNAMAKVTAAAVKYNKNSPGSVQLDAFQRATMEPHVFKEQLRRVFNIKLSPPELGALMSYFDPNDEGCIQCSEFLIQFQRRGFEERGRIQRLWREREEELRARKAQRSERKAQAGAERNALKVNFRYTDEDKTSAMEKLRVAAIKYDRSHPASSSLDAFECATMEPHVFKEQLKLVLNLKFSAPEMGALVHYFDRDSVGIVNCSDFVTLFLKMGFEERSRIHRETREQQRMDQHRRREEAARKEAEAAAKNALQVSYEYDEEQYESAMNKLRTAAFKYDRNTAGAVQLDAFEGAVMEPHVFKEQLRRVFNIKLNPAELGALMHHFDKDEDGTVNCSEFLVGFFRTGFSERSRVRAEWRALQLEREQKRLKMEEEKQTAAEAKNALQVSYEYDEEQYESAMNKLRTAAFKYDRNTAGAVQLDAFEGAFMEPHVFKEQLRRVFNIKLNPAELGALMHHFDKDEDGTVNCSEFLVGFFRTGFSERSRVRAEWREQKKEKAERARAREEARLRANEARGLAKVDFGFTEEEFDSALRKLLRTAAAYDKRMVGFAGLTAFKGSSLTPSEFREQLKCTFNMLLTPQELGALSTFFDLDGLGFVDCANFVVQFFRMSSHMKTIEKRENPEEHTEHYMRRLRDGYERRIMERSAAEGGHADVLPASWNDSSALLAHKAVRVQPRTAAAKLRRRLDAGRRTGRFDLSTAAGELPEVPIEDDTSSLASLDSATDNNNNNNNNNVHSAARSETAESTETGMESKADSLASEAVRHPRMLIEFRLTEVPDEIWKCTFAHELWLCNNPIGELSPQVSRLQNLSVLSLRGIGLTELCPVVATLANLRKLYLSHNYLQDLPAEMEDMSHLQELNLACNRFAHFPAILCNVSGLVRLDLSGNRSISVLPTWLPQLSALAVLYLDDTNVGQSGLSLLPECRSLRDLSVARTPTPVDCEQQLLASSRLERIRIVETRWSNRRSILGNVRETHPAGSSAERIAAESLLSCPPTVAIDDGLDEELRSMLKGRAKVSRARKRAERLRLRR